ncbi:MAG: hypothetical protein WB511_07470 [Nitrososphaeraceae archaeon]
MFVKVNSFGDHTVLVTELQIDDLGSVIPIRDLELRLPISDKTIAKILKMSKYAAIFTEDNSDDNDSTVILASSISEDELDREKSRIINFADNKRDFIS